MKTSSVNCHHVAGTAAVGIFGLELKPACICLNRP
jgi:hypothetical protein